MAPCSAQGEGKLNADVLRPSIDDGCLCLSLAVASPSPCSVEENVALNCPLSSPVAMGWTKLSSTRTGTFPHQPIRLSSNRRHRQPAATSCHHHPHDTVAKEKRSVCVLVFPFQVKKNPARAKNSSSLLFISSSRCRAMVGPPQVGPTAVSVDVAASEWP